MKGQRKGNASKSVKTDKYGIDQEMLNKRIKENIKERVYEGEEQKKGMLYKGIKKSIKERVYN